MAMNGDNLGDEIAALVVTSGLAPEVTDDLTALCQAIGNAVVAHLIANAVIGPGSFEVDSPLEGLLAVTGTGVVQA